jgi:HD-GYP domain-containing protein (c-di-GMP phosphodiesterase class II)
MKFPVLKKDLFGRLNSEDDALFTRAQAVLYSLKAKDETTYRHSLNVGGYSLLIGRKVGLDEQRNKALYVAACLHDIGKIGIDDAILKKTGLLSDAEYAEIVLHPVIGEKIVSDLPEFRYAANIVRCHHERCDGQGYPDRLQRQDIPLESRIIAVADSYDAMTTRTYSGYAKTKGEALAEIRREMNRQFDTEFAQSFIDFMS